MNSENNYIDELIQKLKSPDPAFRIDACVSLNNFLHIPPEAVQALQEAAHDPDEDVAGAARRALAVHVHPEATPEPAQQEAYRAPLIGTVERQPVPSEYFSWSQVWIKATTDLSIASYQALLDDPDASSSRGLTWVGFVGLIIGLLSLLINLLNGPSRGVDAGNTDGGLFFQVCSVPLAVAALMLSVALSAAILNLIARVLGGEGNYAKLVYLVSAFSAPLVLISSVIAIIPKVSLASFLINIYILVLCVLAIMTVYKFSTGKAILTVFIPTIVVVLIGVCVFASILQVL